MNILHVESSPNWGGQEYRTLAETRWLNKNGHRAWIACNPASALYSRAEDVRVGVRMRSSFDLSACREIFRFCRAHSIDVVHVHSPKDAWICYPLHAMGVPLVRSRQITNVVKKKWSRSFVYRRGCAKVIAAADCIRRDLIARNGVAPNRIEVVGEGVDTAQFHPGENGAAFRREFGITPNQVLFGIVAMIRPEKGHEIFVKAACEVLKAHPQARFAIIGEGTGARETEHAIRALVRSTFGSEPRGPVFLTGHRNDMPTVMAGLDVLVVPSTAEAQSLVVPQAFATGRAVIASDVGGLPELVTHEDTGLLVAPGCARALAITMSRLAADRALRTRLARRGYEHARQHLSFDGKMALCVSIYREVARPPSAPLRARVGQRASQFLRGEFAWQFKVRHAAISLSILTATIVGGIGRKL